MAIVYVKQSDFEVMVDLDFVRKVIHRKDFIINYFSITVIMETYHLFKAVVQRKLWDKEVLMVMRH